uniref:hypothetical protein n=2 Tax=Limosilactobacillus pulli TaxID=2991833 RepID=UPI0024BB79A0
TGIHQLRSFCLICANRFVQVISCNLPYLNLDPKIIATDLVMNERLEQKESEKKLRKSACDRFSEFVFAPPQGWLGRSNADLSAFELPASYCAEALLSIK